MEETKQQNKTKNLLYFLSGLIGISLIILIHEMGHFLLAKFFNIPTPLFSIGFGPSLYSFSIGQTVFKIAAIPFGGYVEMNETIFATLSYLPKLLILVAGIVFNLIFAYAILFFYTISHQITLKKTLIHSIKSSSSTEEPSKNMVIGPLGIINMIGQSLANHRKSYWLTLAILSLNVALFNILPLPFFDGGKVLILTIETVMGITIPAMILWMLSTILFTLFIIIVAQITINDIKQLLKNK